MKFLSALIILGLAAGAPASAGTMGPEDCSAFSTMAESIMRARQVGLPMHEAMAIPAKIGARKAGPEIAALVEFAQQLVVIAYEQPGYGSDVMQARAITDFGNQIYLACIKN